MQRNSKMFNVEMQLSVFDTQISKYIIIILQVLKEMLLIELKFFIVVFSFKLLSG